uniref:ATP synthase F(0) complex subunit a n=2 Tax=Panthera TaxID=9688 RepID=A0A8C9JA26_PANTA
MNKNLFAFFTTPTIGLPIVILIVIFPSILFPSPNRLVNNSRILISLVLFIGSTNLLGLLPHSFTPTTQLSINLASTVVTGFSHFLPQGMPLPLIPMLAIIETVSLFIQPIALAVRLTANITAGHLLIHLIGGATLALISISTSITLITFIILVLLTILEFAVALIQAYVFTLLVSLYLHNNT